jgi:hypothetical protein
MSATATASKTLNIDGLEVPINGERNLLELIRKAGIDLPTFCYHSDLSVYGACRLCLVDIAGRGIQGACSTPPEPGLKVRTQTEEIREIRKIAIELLLANHERECPTCAKSAACQLQDIARKLGIQKVRFKPVHEPARWTARRSRSCATRTSACSAATACGSARKSRASARLTLPIAATSGGAAGVRQGPRRGRMRQLRPVRRRLPDRRAHAEIGGGRSLEGLERPGQDGRRANRPGGARGHRRGVRHAARRIHARPDGRGDEAARLRQAFTTPRSAPT